jgi:hypothetical protein
MDAKIYFRQEEIKLGCGSTAKNTVAEDYYEAFAHLKKALTIKADFKEAQEFLSKIRPPFDLPVI